MKNIEFIEKCCLYVLGKITLKELEEWYTPFITQLYEENNETIRYLLDTLELGLIHIQEAIETEDEVKKQIENVLIGKEIVTFTTTLSNKWKNTWEISG